MITGPPLVSQFLKELPGIPSKEQSEYFTAPKLNLEDFQFASLLVTVRVRKPSPIHPLELAYVQWQPTEEDRLQGVLNSTCALSFSLERSDAPRNRYARLFGSLNFAKIQWDIFNLSADDAVFTESIVRAMGLRIHIAMRQKAKQNHKQYRLLLDWFLTRMPNPSRQSKKEPSIALS